MARRTRSDARLMEKALGDPGVRLEISPARSIAAVTAWLSDGACRWPPLVGSTCERRSFLERLGEVGRQVGHGRRLGLGSDIFEPPVGTEVETPLRLLIGAGDSRIRSSCQRTRPRRQASKR